MCGSGRGDTNPARCRRQVPAPAAAKGGIAGRWGDYILEPCTLLCLRVVEAVATSCRHAAVTPWRHVSMRVLTLLAAHALQACGNSLQ